MSFLDDVLEQDWRSELSEEQLEALERRPAPSLTPAVAARPRRRSEQLEPRPVRVLDEARRGRP